LSVASSTNPAEVLPSRTSLSTCEALIFTKANSAATNRPFKATRMSAKTSVRPSRANPFTAPSGRVSLSGVTARLASRYSMPR
jgi:putative salt-induced outer membrane protein YdiY